MREDEVTRFSLSLAAALVPGFPAERALEERQITLENRRSPEMNPARQTVQVFIKNKLTNNNLPSNKIACSLMCFFKAFYCSATPR